MELDLSGIRARVDAAAEGPWQWNLERVDQRWDDTGPTLETVARGPVYGDGSQGAAKVVVSGWGHHDAWGTNVEPADAAFIAHAREDVPALLAEVERLRAVAVDVEARVREQIAVEIEGSVEGHKDFIAEISGVPRRADRDSMVTSGMRRAVCIARGVS